MKKIVLCEDALRWMRAQKNNPDKRSPGQINLAALTGQDFAALKTFVHALELYCYSDDDGRANALLCMRHAVLAMQPSTRYIAREAIPHQLDWGDREKLWPKLCPVSPQGRVKNQPVRSDGSAPSLPDPEQSRPAGEAPGVPAGEAGNSMGGPQNPITEPGLVTIKGGAA